MGRTVEDRPQTLTVTGGADCVYIILGRFSELQLFQFISLIWASNFVSRITFDCSRPFLFNVLFTVIIIISILLLLIIFVFKISDFYAFD
jgi:hypothetical protein